MVRCLACVVVSTLLLGCTVDRTMQPLTDAEAGKLAQFMALHPQHQAMVTDGNEPGTKLLMCVTVIDAATRQVVPNQLVSFYHASAAGEYHATVPGDKTTTRLKASGTTDALGRLLVKTILPGDYGRMQDNRHIHSVLRGAEPEGYDIHFKQYSAPMIRDVIDNSRQHFLVNLCASEDSTLVTFINLTAQYPEQED